MRKIYEYIEQINEEIYSAKDFAETYLHFKVEDNQEWANKYKAMAEDELRHAANIRDLAVQSMNKIKSVYKPPSELQEAFDKSNDNYFERVAWIKQMLSM